MVQLHFTVAISERFLICSLPHHQPKRHLQVSLYLRALDNALQAPPSELMLNRKLCKAMQEWKHPQKTNHQHSEWLELEGTLKNT